MSVLLEAMEPVRQTVNITLKPGEDGQIIAECPAIPGCRSQGATREEAIENIREAIEACLEVRASMGWQPFEETVEIEVEV